MEKFATQTAAAKYQTLAFCRVLVCFIIKPVIFVHFGTDPYETSLCNVNLQCQMLMAKVSPRFDCKSNLLFAALFCK